MYINTTHYTIDNVGFFRGIEGIIKVDKLARFVRGVQSRNIPLLNILTCSLYVAMLLCNYNVQGIDVT